MVSERRTDFEKTDIVMLIGIIIYLLFTVRVTGIYLFASHKLKVDLQYII